VVEPLLAVLGGGLGLAALAAFPGLVVVRAPWWAVPFLSAAFWIVSWWWWPLGRGHFVSSALAGFVLLTSLRLLKPLDWSWPSRATLGVVAGSAAAFVPLLFTALPPGADVSLHARDAALLVWHDGVPASAEPLLPGQAFRPGRAGVSGLAADLALLTALPVPRSAFLAAALADALLYPALFAFLARLVPAGSAALATLVALAFPARPDPAAALGLGLVLAAAALLVRGQGRSPAFASALFLAAGVTSDPAAVWGAVPLLGIAGALAGVKADDRKPVVERFAIAVGGAMVLVAPFVRRHTSAPLALSPGSLAPWTVVVAAAALAWAGRSGRSVSRGLTIVLLTVALLGTGWRRVHVEPDVQAGDFRAFDWIRENTRPFDVVCVGIWEAGQWVPAAAGRAIEPGAGRPCALRAVPGRWGQADGADVAFRDDAVTLLRNP